MMNNNTTRDSLIFVLVLGAFGLLISILGLALLVVEDGKITLGEAWFSILLLGFVVFSLWKEVICPLRKINKE